MRSSIFTSNLFFIHSTYLFLCANFLLAYVGDGWSATLLKLLRESWLIVGLIYIIFSRRLILLCLLFLLVCPTLIIVIFNQEADILPTSYYGIRDLVAVLLVFDLIRRPPAVESQSKIFPFVFLCAVLTVSEVAFNLVSQKLAMSVFPVQSYSETKGVTFSLYGGVLLGHVLYMPFFSPNGLATFSGAAGLILIAQPKPRYMLAFILNFSVFLLCVSKVSLFALLLLGTARLMRGWRLIQQKTCLLIIFGISFCCLLFWEEIFSVLFMTTKGTPFYIHVASLWGHIRGFTVALAEGLANPLPGLMGEHTVIGMRSLTNTADFIPIESTIMSRAMSMGFLQYLFFTYLLWCFLTVKQSLYLLVFSAVCFLLSATSNYIVYYVPAIWWYANTLQLRLRLNHQAERR